jgi:diguanylate cyclase (GGDEF)-like protein/PAS domain S-box-containing protein
MDTPKELGVYESILKTIADPFFIIGENGTYLDVLGGTDRSLYDDAQTLKGKNIYHFMEKEFAQFFMDKVKMTFEMNRLHSFEYKLETETVKGILQNGPGGIQWFEARMFPLQFMYEGQKAVVTLLINITERKKLQQKLKDLSYKDPLTMVGNRRYFFEKLDAHIDIYAKDKTPCAVVVIDVDNFKIINDTYGHYVGDQVLKEISQLLTSGLQKDDYVARFGGDEFIVALIGYAGSDSVLKWADSIRMMIEQHPFIVGDITLFITISMGITDMLIMDGETTSIVSRADKALYEAKHNGRNRVEVQ